MKKVFAILAAASFVTFASCGGAAKTEECTPAIAVEEVDFEDGEEEILEEETE